MYFHVVLDLRRGIRFTPTGVLGLLPIVLGGSDDMGSRCKPGPVLSLSLCVILELLKQATHCFCDFRLQSKED